MLWRGPVAGILAAVYIIAGIASAWAQDLPRGPGRDLAYAKCQTCHDLTYLHDSAGIPEWMWHDVMDSMVEYGLEVTPEQRETLLAYLTTYLGPDPPPPGPPEEQSMTTADGGALYQRHCVACHGAGGAGSPGTFPPLADNPALDDARYVVQVLLHGLRGEIEVAGETYRGVMPSFGHLEDAELAVLATHVLGRFSALECSIGANDVEELRAQPVDAVEIRPHPPAAELSPP
ncbi:MAG: cytochrome c [Gammaproteobacteria bacterium]|nr:cytochrome c [Gammaproteobacteria bacterium]